MADPTKGIKIGSGGVSDAVAGTDALGFDPYVKAIAAFLTDPTTVPPLTLSVEGEWGAGKSSFMRLLRNELEENVKKGRPLAIVEFNAWRNDKEDALWAAFAIEFLRQLAPHSWRKRLLAHLKLWGLRFDLREGWYDALRFTLLLLVVFFTPFSILPYIYHHGFEAISAALFTKNGDLEKFIFSLGGVTGYIILLIVFLRKFKEVVGNPFAINLQRYIDKPDYEEHTAFIEKFHRDFAKIVRTYLPVGKAFVFIDDLDRCEVPRAADLMQALNLLMSAESAPLIFVLGIDREMVAAGLAAKYETLLPYFTVSRGGTSGPVAGLEYGYAFLEKFIQLPFQVPRPRDVDIDKLLDSLGAEPISVTAGSPKSPTRPDLLEVVLDKDSSLVRNIIKMIAPPLDYNPRRLKQFVNLFRLKTYIASETGLFVAASAPEFASLTLEKLAKVVALTLRWPRLLTVLASTPQLLYWLQRGVWLLPPNTNGEDLDEASKDQFKYWLAKPRIVDLLRLPFKNEAEMREYLKDHSLDSLDDPKAHDWGLDRLDIERLLETSPRRIKEAVPPRTPGGPKQGSTPPPQKANRREDEDIDAQTETVVSKPPGSSQRSRDIKRKK